MYLSVPQIIESWLISIRETDFTRFGYTPALGILRGMVLDEAYLWSFPNLNKSI